MMTDKIYTIEEIQAKVQPIAEKYKLKKVSLFGSYSRGEATENSDIDLYIVDSAESYKGIKCAVGAIYGDFEDALGKEIDIVDAGAIKQGWNKWYVRALFKNIKNDEVVLYDYRDDKRFERTGTYA